MGVERELKFTISAQAAQQLGDHAVLRLMSEMPLTQDLATYYFDTADARLEAAGMVLRLRRGAQVKVVTVKSMRAEGADDHAAVTHARGEWEWEVDGQGHVDGEGAPALSTVDLERALRETPLGTLGLDLPALRRDLRPVFGTAFARTLWGVRWGGTRMEVALDRGACTALREGRVLKSPLTELEIELIAGDWSDCWDLAWALAQDLPIFLSPINKAQRASALAAGTQVEALPEPPRVPSGASIGEAAQVWLGTAAAQLAVWAERIGASEDARSVHQFRVVLRRLRTALRWLAPDADAGAMRWFVEELRWAMQVAGVVRDADVWLDVLAEQSETHVSEQIRRRRAEGCMALGAYLDSPRFGRLLLALARWAEVWAQGATATGGKSIRKRRPARHQELLLADLAKRAIGQDHKRWRKTWASTRTILHEAARDGCASAQGAAMLHILRIQSKRLRLSLERVGHALEDGDSKALHQLLNRVEALQSHLGDWHDVQRLLHEYGEAAGMAPEHVKRLTTRARDALVAAWAAAQ